MIEAAGDRVLDAMSFGAQENGVSLGRYPDGGPEIRVLSGLSAGYANDEPANYDIVINEIMYHPISEETLDEYVELFNRGGSDVSVDNWRFTQGIRYTFPEGTVIPAGGYLVVAKEAARLIAAHPAALDATNAIGDFSGNLSDRGERIVLCRPDDPLLPDQDFVVVDEVSYRDGESWGEWSDGDFDGDYDVDRDDFVILRDNFGLCAPGKGGSELTPEPAALSLLALGGLALLRRRQLPRGIARR